MSYRARVRLSLWCGLLAAVAILPFLFGGEEAKIRAALEHGAEAVEEANLDTTASMISPTYSGKIGIDRDQGVAFAEWFYHRSRSRRISLEKIDVKIDGERARIRQGLPSRGRAALRTARLGEFGSRLREPLPTEQG